jgi:hypothetical protein
MPHDQTVPPTTADFAEVGFNEWRHWFEVALSGAALDAAVSSEADAVRIVSRADLIATQAWRLIQQRTPAARRT